MEVELLLFIGDCHKDLIITLNQNLLLIYHQNLNQKLTYSLSHITLGPLHKLPLILVLLDFQSPVHVCIEKRSLG